MFFLPFTTYPFNNLLLLFLRPGEDMIKVYTDVVKLKIADERELLCGFICHCFFKLFVEPPVVFYIFDGIVSYFKKIHISFGNIIGYEI